MIPPSYLAQLGFQSSTTEAAAALALFGGLLLTALWARAIFR